MMNMLSLKVAAILLIVAALFSGGWKAAEIYYVGLANEKQVLEDEAVQQQLATNLKMRADYEMRINNAENENVKNKNTINKLGDFIDGLLPPKQIICGSTMQLPTTTSKNIDGNSGVATTGIDGYIAISARDKARIIKTYKRCAQLNIDAITVDQALNTP